MLWSEIPKAAGGKDLGVLAEAGIKAKKPPWLFEVWDWFHHRSLMAAE